MPPYERHVFICINERPDDDARSCCSAKEAKEIRARLKKMTKEAGLGRRVRINAAGCLDQCAHGVTIVVYPETVWYGLVTVDDVDELFHSHVVEGRPVERLRLRHMRKPDDA
jgi:(2Fe-2S) ferredoxin